jgi:hypothetical protein
VEPEGDALLAAPRLPVEEEPLPEFPEPVPDGFDGTSGSFAVAALAAGATDRAGEEFCACAGVKDTPDRLKVNKEAHHAVALRGEGIVLISVAPAGRRGGCRTKRRGIDEDAHATPAREGSVNPRMRCPTTAPPDIVTQAGWSFVSQGKCP